MHLISSFVIAFATYSRLPMPRVEWTDENRRYALCFFPLIGVVIALLLWLWILLCGELGTGVFLKGTVGALLPLLVTGGIHMDGFMDTTDARASWQTPEKRLDILKDSHVGAFAVIGCAVYLLLFSALVSEMNASQAAMAGACTVLSRALSAYLSISLKQARPGGMLDGFASTAAGRAVRLSAIVYTVLAVGFVALLSPLTALLCCLFAAAGAAYYRQMAVKYFGGVTGDLAGWFLCVTELMLLIAVRIGGYIG